jgi:threonine/homoserine/homoserine lactone efflux protein
MEGLLLGLSLGLGAGLAPGPLLALVIRSTLQDGLAAGTRVAFSPLLTDVPIIALAVVLASSLPDEALGALGVVGGGFVIWLGVEAWREVPAPAEAAAGAASPTRDLARGALVNALSPHPWVFWITVGSPILAAQGTGGSAAFLGAFYVALIGSKVAVAAMLHAGRDRLLQGRGYGIVLRASAILLLATGVLLAVEGLHSLLPGM